MSHPCPMAACPLEAGEWALCRSHVARLAGDLASIPRLVAEVEATMARAGSGAGRGGPRSIDPPLGYDPRASAALGGLRACLVGWVRDLAEGRDVEWPADEVGACARWLADRMAVLRVHPAAVEVATEVGTWVAACWAALDRPPPRTFAGPCECGAALYVRPGRLVVKCPSCAVVFDLAERRAWLLEEARDYRLTIPELGRALPAWVGQDVAVSKLRTWRARGRLRAVGLSEGGRETYRIGDVLDLLAGHAGPTP